MNLTELVISVLARLLTGTTPWARVVTQGVEQALVATAIECSWNGIRAGVRLLTNSASF